MAGLFAQELRKALGFCYMVPEGDSSAPYNPWRAALLCDEGYIQGYTVVSAVLHQRVSWVCEQVNCPGHRVRTAPFCLVRPLSGLPLA